MLWRCHFILKTDVIHPTKISFMFVYIFPEQNWAYPALHIQFMQAKLKSRVTSQHQRGKGFVPSLGYTSRKPRKYYHS